ncbi:MAG: hypothetical protein R6W77_12500 [Trueperaceae bacterium]
MKVVLFCGGYGLRLRDHAPSIPKPVVPLGNEPLLVHVMRYYAHFGHDEFILCLGYRGDRVRAYFDERRWSSESLAARVEDPRQDIDRWSITFADTGLDATIGDRLRLVRPLVDGEPTFLANYSDSLTDADLPSWLASFEASGNVASFMAVRPHLSLHHVEVDEASGRVTSIRGIRDALRINGGYFVLRQGVFDVLEEGDELVETPFAKLMEGGALTAQVYDGFWSTVDTFKDHQRLEALLQRGPAPWQLWRLQERALALHA